jgi:hypothetical protein
MRSIVFDRSRRGLIKALALLTGGALGDRLPVRAEDSKPKAVMKKYSKEKVGYRDEPYLGRNCARCVLYSGDGVCAIVEGQVSPDGWCTQWTPSTMGRSGTPTAV